MGISFGCGLGHSALSQISGVIEATGQCLRQPDGNLFYLGCGPSGLIGVVDASEMVDTYGSRVDEVRAFVDGGWSACSNNEGDMSSLGVLFRLSWDDFGRDCLGKLTASDMVVLVDMLPGSAIIKQVEQSSARLCAINVLSQGMTIDSRFNPVTGDGAR